MLFRLCCIGLAFAVDCLADAPSPPFRGIDNTGVFTDDGAVLDWAGDRPPERWRFPVGLGYAAVAVFDNRAYTVGNNNAEKEGIDTVYCLNADNGEKLWEYTYPQDRVNKYNPGGPNATPVVDGDWLYVLGKEGMVTCLDRKNGTPRWQHRFAPETVGMPMFGFASAPIIIGDALYLNVGDGGWALDKNTGSEIWHSGPGKAGYGCLTPLNFHNQPALALVSMTQIRIVARADGTPLWSTNWKTNFGENSSTPIVHDNILYYSSWWDRGAIAFDLTADPPQELWRDKHLQNHIVTSVLYEGHLYGSDGPVHKNQIVTAFCCVELRTGIVKWREEGLIGAPLMVGSRMLLLNRDGRLILLTPTPESYQPRKQAQVLADKSWTPPIYANGRLYCRSGDGFAVCLDVTTP